MRWLSRNTDNIILTVFSVLIGGLISWYFFFRQKNPKTLDYAVLSNEPIGTGAAGNEDRLKVVWEGDVPGYDRDRHVLKDPRICRLRIRNTGKREIQESDFQEPIEVSVPRGIILDVSVSNSSHSGMYPLGSIKGGDGFQCEFKPKLMNSGDWLDLLLITDGATDDPEVKCWMTGESRPIRRVAGLSTESPWKIFRNAVRLLFDEDKGFTGLALAGLVTGIVGVITTFFP